MALGVEVPAFARNAPKGTFRHRAAFDIPGDAHGLLEGAGSNSPDGAIRMARNDFGDTRYDGPQPSRTTRNSVLRALVGTR